MKMKVDLEDYAFDGESAIKKIMNKNCAKCNKGYRLVIMDLNMPGLDGKAATKKIVQMI
jgi:CheY-like chemotaxis protein